MVSEKPARILRRMGVDEQAISAMDDAAAWRVIYANKPRPKVRPTTICFTGFPDSQKSTLRQTAEEIGLVVTTAVSGSTAYLCAGPNAGPKKLEKAESAGTVILTLEGFYEIVGSGVLP